MLLLTLEKPRRKVVQPQNITSQNKQRSKEHNELTKSTYRNIRKILKQQRISTLLASIGICFTRNTARTPQETQLRSRIRHLMITLARYRGTAVCMLSVWNILLRRKSTKQQSHFTYVGRFV